MTATFHICSLLALLLLTGCSSIQSRIDRNPALFTGLTAEEQQLVLQGEVREGMNEDAVFLAWGEPDQRVTLSREGRTVERWIYLGPRTTIVTGVWGGSGYGRRTGGWWVDYPMSDTLFLTELQPVRMAEFHRAKVVAWAALEE